jgi:hypothetical protein
VRQLGATNYLTLVKKFADGWVDGNAKWIQLYPYDSWDHPLFGTTTIDRDVAAKLKSSFVNKVKDQRIFTDYEHGMDKAKGNKASGELLEVDVRDDGLWGLVKFTDTAKEEIDNGEWNYWSTAHYDSWTNPHTNENFEYVLDGGALTNKPWVKGMLPLNFSELVVEKLEMAPEEHQNPLEGPNYEKFGDDDAHESGSRLETPPEGEDGTVPDRSKTVTTNNSGGGNGMTPEEILAALREKLGIEEDADVVSHVEGLNAELEPLRELKKHHEDQKKFSEMFPEEFARMQALEAANRDSVVKQFSDALANRRFARTTGDKDDEGNAITENTTYGLSALAVEEMGGLVKKFSERTANLDDFKGVMETVFNGGIVDYGNKGSELAPSAEDTVVRGKDNLEGRKLFAEKVNEIVEKDELSFDAAIKVAVEKYPELYEQYLSPVTAR